jgi:hypothetical protein
MKESDLRNPKFLEDLFNAPWPRWKSMKESDWAACNDPSDMVGFLSDSGKLSERKARLFAVACCFHCFWYRLEDDRTRIAAGVAARHAEGLVEAQEVREAAASARAVAETVTERDDQDAADLSTRRSEILYYDARAAQAAAEVLNEPLLAAISSTYAPSNQQERQMQVNFIRDLVGPLPFRPVTLSPSVRMWNSGTVVRLAQAIYEELPLLSNSDTIEWFRRRREQALYPSRQLPSDYLDSQRLGVLADALLDAGCDEEELIGHCRSEGPHLRGCWAVDLVLGKE